MNPLKNTYKVAFLTVEGDRKNLIVEAWTMVEALQAVASRYKVSKWLITERA